MGEIPVNITVNAVAPGVIDTAIHQRFNTPKSLEKLRQIIPLARIGLRDSLFFLSALCVCAFSVCLGVTLFLPIAQKSG